MKSFTFRLTRNPTNKILVELRRAVKTGVPYVRDDEMLCGSVESMMTVISKAKFEVFAAVVKHHPETLNKLAEILDKDLGNVSRDAHSLEAIGLIDLLKDNAKDSRQVRPVAKYDQIVFDFNECSQKTGAG